MSDFGGLSIGLSGLLAHRKALDVAGRNLANVNTRGASRQRSDLTPITNSAGAAIFSRISESGAGVTAGTPYRLRDQFLDLRGIQEHGVGGALTQSQGLLAQIEAAVNEPSDTGLSSQMSAFMAAWDGVANHPDDLAARQQLVELANTLADSFGRLNSSLSTLGNNSTLELQSVVTDTNATALAVADLNNRILANVNADLPAGDLMDQRDRLVEHLADQAGVTVRAQDKGVVDVYLGSTALVRGNHADALRIDSTTTPGATAVVWDRLDRPADVGGRSGALQGAINTTIPNYQARLTAVAQQLNDEVNAVHATGFDLDGSAGIPFFQMGAQGLQVNPAVSSDPRKVAAAASATALRDGSVAAKIAGISGPSDSYRAFVLHLGVESATVNRQANTQSAITEQVDAARTAASGINIDEEMTNLVAIKHAYDASARFISAVDSMLETLIKNTGLVGR